MERGLVACTDIDGLMQMLNINPLNAKLNAICHLLVLLEGHHILHISRIRVNHNPLDSL